MAQVTQSLVDEFRRENAATGKTPYTRHEFEQLLFAWEELQRVRAALAAQPAEPVEQAIAALKIALRDSKGWMQDYSDSIIRDAIDRVPAPAAVPMTELRCKCGATMFVRVFCDGAGGGPDDGRPLLFETVSIGVQP